MTRINTNVASLISRNNLSRSNADLSQALTRLSTGLRINTGKDDPAGLIASENLRSDITSIQRAISNTERAEQVIATADSALGQVSSLLNDIRGLVTESANAGALSEEQIAANQLQVDSSLEALNRIAQTTTFQGRRLLDGSLDFITNPGASAASISALQIDQANLGATGQVSVDVNVTTAATQATFAVENLPDVTPTTTASVSFSIETTAAVGSTGTVNFTALTSDTTQSVTDIALDTGAGAGLGDTLTITALEDGAADGAVTYTVVVNDNTSAGANAAQASYNETTDTLTINADITGGVGSDDVAAAIAAATDTGSNLVFSASSDGTANLVAADEATIEGLTVGNTTAGADATSTAVSIDITGTTAAGSSGDIDIDFVEAAIGAAEGPTRVIGNATTGYTVQVNTDNAGGVTIENIETALESIDEIDTVDITAGAGSTFNLFDVAAVPELPTTTQSLANGVDSVRTTETIDLTTAIGVTGNIDINFAEANLSGGGTNLIDLGVISGAQTYTLEIDNSVGVSIDDIRAALESITEIGTASFDAFSPGTSIYTASADAEPSTLNLVGAGATTATSGIDADLVLELAGSTGSEVLSFEAGTTLGLLIEGVNAVSDATGVTAAANGTDDGIIFTSSAYGSDAFINLEVIEEGAGGDFIPNLTSGGTAESRRVTGTDIVASINGITATGDGNDLSINTATLDLSATIDAGFTGTIEFDITGGGALFQLGPDVVSNQQARLGITSVNTAALGGTNGLLYQLGTGGTADLSTDATTAAAIVEEAIDQVTSLRGRLGAFQRTTLETNRSALNDTLSNLTQAESSVRDADFAAETAALTRSQILVQSGTRVLAIANQNPQNVLALLG